MFAALYTVDMMGSDTGRYAAPVGSIVVHTLAHIVVLGYENSIVHQWQRQQAPLVHGLPMRGQ